MIALPPLMATIKRRCLQVMLGALALLSLSTMTYAQVDIKMNAEEKEVADTIKQRLKDLRGIKDLEVFATKSISGLYEIVIGGDSFAYADKEVNFIVQGRLMDGKTLQDLTSISEEKYDRVDIKSLPLKNAIKLGNGKRVFYTFEDPRCGFCKKLAEEMQQMENVTVYVFAVSFLGPESTTQVKSILCNKNPSEAWINTTTKNAPPTAKPSDDKCETKLNDNNALARKLRINGTPAIIFSDGSRFKGYVPKDGIEARLKEIANKK